MVRRIILLCTFVIGVVACSASPSKTKAVQAVATQTQTTPPSTLVPTTVSPDESSAIGVTEAPTTTEPTTTELATTVPATTAPATTVPITAPPPPVDLPAVPLLASGTPVSSANNEWLGVGPLYLDARGPAADCQTFLAAISPDPYVYSACGQWAGAGLNYAWTVSQNTLADGIHALLWHEIEPDRWEPVLKHVSEPGVLTGVTMVAAELDAVPGPELAVGFRHAGTNDLLDVDVIDTASGSLQVVAHLPGLAHASARIIAGGGIDLWAAVVVDPNATVVLPYQQALLTPSWSLVIGAPASEPAISLEDSEL